MSHQLALLDPTHTTVVEYPVVGDRKWELTRVHNLDGATDANLLAFDLVRVEDTEPPPLEFGETLDPATAVKIDDVWTQQWTKSNITLTEAKQRLGRLAVGLYWGRFVLEPTVTEFQNAGRNGVTVLQGRATRFQAAIDDVATRIQGATSIAQAYAIYQELEALS